MWVMPDSPMPSSSVQAARLRLGGQLRKIREASGLSGRDFARRAGWADATSVTKVEKGQRAITADHIRLWCRLCGVSDLRRDELLADQESVARMWVSNRELGRKIGLNATQRMTIGEMFAQVSSVRTYQTKVVPGLLQTPGYMTGVLRGVRRERHVEPDDVTEAVTERLARQRWLRVPGKRFEFMLEEAVLRYRPYGDDVHHEQLLHLMEVSRLPAVTLWIVPMDVDREGVRPRESFDINTFPGHREVMVELLSGLLTLNHLDDLEMYQTAWDDLRSIAVRGAEARALVRRALERLDPGRGDG
ncbi:helix-turn-helix transcriptional regulator [Sphaerisporangium sp. NPDC051017]|uniref:helix-turn-helix domain-containing protein n=1 Tax=Sphaerisporangium sp. NPDC051017 TaxID=3154636 RepID=UPI00342A5B24